MHAGAAPAPGSITSRITWINTAAGTWNLLQQPWLPAGSFTPGQGTYIMAETADTRSLQVNDLPLDRQIGDWPTSAYSALTAIDPNPGVPAARTFTREVPRTPTVAATTRWPTRSSTSTAAIRR